MDYVFKSIYFDFPDRAERRTVVGDCTAQLFEECPGHQGAHQDGRAIDLGYYVYQGGNVATSYLPDGWTRINMWTSDAPTASILTNVFDWERTWVAAKRIRQYLTGITIMDTRIKSYIAKRVREKFGYNEYRLVMTTISADDPMHLNHHTHPHYFVNRFIR